MTYKILPTKEFSKDFRKLDKNFQDVKELDDNHTIYGVVVP